MVGSFLNVCIYRMPLDLSVNEPKRSFCPHCKKQIPWYQNIPIWSWLTLGGKCANCKKAIPVRYLLVEALTGLCFLTLWLVFPWQLALPYMVLLGIFIPATFIDIEHYIIPDELTIGGTVAGILLALLFPPLMGANTWWISGLYSLLGAATGFFTLWGVVELGKLAFGKKALKLDAPSTFHWHRIHDDATMKVGNDSLQWSEIFSRESDQLLLEASDIKIDGKKLPDTSIKFFYNRLVTSKKTIDLMTIETIEAKATRLVIPREAMGFGDVKFLACIGAFLGWKAVFFTILASSLIGSLVGITALLLRRREWSAKLPFGPYLAFGAVLWMFFGQHLLDWYWNTFLAPPELFFH